ncbi:MAG: DNA-(apurinic or apyrimidinic site) lyase [Candidatus Diapherotrites archaeon]|nr:DNA-(apurinic or apyrimidinic site) lyase [Candidatus Diapherotrites archaeon]MDN5367238.1 DNA-(apurinic or apyrimidinic site) lyase [Candidatus Diapherotrites archaeon]
MVLYVCVIVHIARVIGEIGVDGARYIEEHIDPQFQALMFLYEKMDDKRAFVPLVTANALVSYQLSGKGEEWWWEFARWFSEHPVTERLSAAYAEFLPKSRTNKRLANIKVKRLEKMENFLLAMRPEKYYENMVQLWKDLAQILGTPRNTKTTVFAVKMFGYAMRIANGKFIPYPFEIPIPVDSRIKKFTEKLGAGKPIPFWNEVAKKSGVPPLHIDSILWPALSGNPEVHEKIKKAFGHAGEELIELLSP